MIPKYPDTNTSVALAVAWILTLDLRWKLQKHIFV